ncbi:hypothetical protein AB0M94_31745 [Streptomyces xanthochromogenes]|uniref:Antitoxin n=1 Tax=Streptomyces xanthochromogenes TaxID=67384 RepID=A0ABQ3AUI8_9ACTN|nr:hypothetical protein [Streptomyces xanthochromogenes]GGY64400.1 hypothetical protein GCM10010326_68910 [Streptomyces xanthochromogenes]
MGVFKWMRDRTEAKMEESRVKAYEKAVARGASEAEAKAAGERAAKRRRRIRRVNMS